MTKSMFNVTRRDGKVCLPSSRYYVLDYSNGALCGREARDALKAYADALERRGFDETVKTAARIREALDCPENAPAQHTHDLKSRAKRFYLRRVAPRLIAATAFVLSPFILVWAIGSVLHREEMASDFAEFVAEAAKAIFTGKDLRV